MDRAEDGRLRFFSELSEHQISADEFFNVVLLDSLARNFGLQNVLISYFDPQGNFLSWTHRNGVLADCEEHPYRRCQPADVVRQTLYREAVQDKLTYNNVTPRLYHSTKLIPPEDYEQSSYVRFLEENFGARYSVTMAFGINAYIQVAFFKSREEGDFTPRAEPAGTDLRLHRQRLQKLQEIRAGQDHLQHPERDHPLGGKSLSRYG